MAETEQIAKMAELASTEIFAVFGWKDIALKNQNWECAEKKRHAKLKGPGTHPSDAVWTYIEPYSGKSVYVNADLKSFASSTIETTDLVKALRSLSRSVECAPKSTAWQRLYADTTRNYEVIGMLFVYNHDGLYKKKFGDELTPITAAQIELQAKDFVGVVGPDRVTYLNSIAKEIKSLQADGKLPPKAQRYFFFPHLTRGMAAHQKHMSVPLDHLLSPLITLGYEFSTTEQLAGGVPREGVIGFYDGRGDSTAEFKYLLDYFIKYQIADGKKQIVISLFQPARDAAAIFGKAKDEFTRDHWPVGDTSEAEFAELLGSIQYREIQSVVQRFSEVDLGMGVRS
jgi:hypothetical protein